MSKKLLPDVLKGDERVTALAELIEKSRQETQELLPFLFIYDLSTLSDSELEDLAWQFDVSRTAWELAQDRSQKEELVKNAVILKMKLGTPWAIKKILQLLNISVDIVEWFETGGNLPPHTFGIKTTSVPENFKKILSVINDYKRESAHLAILTDGNCRSRLNLDRSCQLSRVLLSSLDGVKKDGVRFCFVEKKKSKFEKTYDTPAEHVTRYLSARHFPVSRTKLDSFKLSRVKAEIPPFSLHSLVWGEGFTHKASQEREFYRQTNCNLVLSSDRLSVKGFQGKVEKSKTLKLSAGSLDRKLKEILPLTCTPSLASSSHFTVPAPSAGSSASRLIERQGGDTPPALSKKLVLSTPSFRYQAAVRSVVVPASSEVPRFWSGSWKGYWTDSYEACGEGTRIQAEDFSALSGGASLSGNFKTPLPVVAYSNTLDAMKLSRETVKFAGWRN